MSLKYMVLMVLKGVRVHKKIKEEQCLSPGVFRYYKIRRTNKKNSKREEGSVVGDGEWGRTRSEFCPGNAGHVSNQGRDVNFGKCCS